MKQRLLLTVLLLVSINLNAGKLEELQQSCFKEHNQEDCYKIAVMYITGDGVQKDITLAIKLFDMLCMNPSSNGAMVCATLGDMYYDGKEIIQDYNKAVNYYTKACDNGNMVACSNIGGMYYSGQGVEKNISKAKEFFNKACSNGDDASCNNLRIMLKEGRKI